jgi:hypothetical protein
MTIRPGALAVGAFVAVAVLATGSTAIAACGAADSVRNDDPPPSTVHDDCGELDNGPDCDGQ